MKRRTVFLLLSLILLSLGFVSDVSDRYFEIAKNMEIYGKVFTEVNTQYVDPTSPSQLMRTGIDAMLESLDPYTVYYGESQVEYSKLINSGQYSGVGCEVSKQGEEFILVNMKAGGPADKAGLRVGDVLLFVDNETISGSNKSIAQIQTLLLGEKSTEVTLGIRRAGKPASYSVIRGGNEAQQDDVPYYGMINDSIGYILQTGFSGAAAQSVGDAIRSLKEEAKSSLKGLVLDLRSNPGGRLDQAVDICNHFIPSGQLIVEMRGRSPETQNKFLTRRPPMDTEIPLAVIVNGRSASASEIVAGAIQDLDRGVIVGSRSFGKGLVQNFRPLSYNSQMKITVAKYYTPSGRCIQAIDYSNRNEDGSVGKVPDSLVSEFQTENGRKVYDGGGIDPDIPVKKPELAPITRALQLQNIIFDFATEFQSRNDSIASSREFEVGENLYRDFVNFVERKDFSFDTQTGSQIKELEKSLSLEEYQSETRPVIDKIKQELASQKKKDLMRHKDQIIPLLRKEIVERYYFRNGVIESGFIHDPDILTSIKLLNEPESYNKALGIKQ